MKKRRSAPEPGYLGDPRLSATAKTLLAMLWRRGFSTQRVWGLSQGDMAMGLNKSIPTVKRALRELRALGYVQIVEKGQGPNAYTKYLLIPAGEQMTMDFHHRSKASRDSKTVVRKTVENLLKTYRNACEQIPENGSKMTPSRGRTGQKRPVLDFLTYRNRKQNNHLKGEQKARDLIRSLDQRSLEEEGTDLLHMGKDKSSS